MDVKITKQKQNTGNKVVCSLDFKLNGFLNEDVISAEFRGLIFSSIKETVAAIDQYMLLLSQLRTFLVKKNITKL